MARSQFVELPVITLFRLPPFFFDWCLISQLFVHVSHACRLRFVCCVLFTVHVLDNSKLLHLALICTRMWLCLFAQHAFTSRNSVWIQTRRLKARKLNGWKFFFILTCAFPTCQNVLCEKRLLSNRTSLDDCPIFLILAFILFFFCAILLTLLTLKYSRE